MMDLAKQEELVLKFQATGDKNFFTDLVEAYRSRIQGKAYDTSLRYKNLDDAEIESKLMEALWKAAKDWIQDLNVPFDKYTSVRFKQCLTRLYTDRKRQECPFEIDYYMSAYEKDGEVDEEGYDLVDPRENVECFIEEQDAVGRLYAFLKSKKPVGAEVAVLKAAGYELAQIAELMNYKPDVQNLKYARKMWTKRRLGDCQEPAKEYYFDVLKLEALPIQIRM